MTRGMRWLAAMAVATAAMTGAAASADLTAAEKEAINAQIRAYILDNPELIVEAMEVLEQREADAQRNADRDLLASLGAELTADGYSHIGGNPDGDVTVVEFTDYRCGYCKQAHDGVMALIASDPNIRYVVKEFPILGPDSTFAARAAMAALAQGDALYVDFNDAMMRHRGELNQNMVLQIAADVGLDAGRLADDIQDPSIAANIQATYALARKLSINGTPAFIIGDEIVRGYLPYDGLKELVEDARERG